MQIIKETNQIIAVYKPNNIPTTYKNATDTSDCMVARVTKLYPKLLEIKSYQPREGGLLYRLDTDTSGVIIFAKTQESFDYLSGIQKENKLYKHYFAITERSMQIADKMSIFVKQTKNPVYVSWENQPVVEHLPEEILGFTQKNNLLKQEQPFKMIDIPIGHSKKSDKRMIAILGANYKSKGTPSKAVSYVRQIEKIGNKHLFEIIISKGCRHQIRVHLSTIGFPIVGDDLYNKDPRNQDEHLSLWCWRIGVKS